MGSPATNNAPSKATRRKAPHDEGTDGTKAAMATAKPSAYRAIHFLRVMMLTLGLLITVHQAYHVRLLSVKIYGYIIHEFDPWFNYRATEYMSEHGWSAFFRWFDYMSWYPLGRPVGSTTYPGLQFTAVAIHRALAALGIPMSLKHVCVLIPAWFGAIATALVAISTYEMCESGITAVIAAFTFMILPAHLMRSMAGEFDNECIALAAMLLVFFLWMRSLRTPASWPIGALVGVAYGYMVAAWGGYTFVLNMVALHAGVAALVDWARNTYNPALLRSYALFYVVGTALATRVPPVGMSPFKSLEQLGALAVLVFLCGLQAAELLRRRVGADVEVRSRQNLRIRARVFTVMGGVAALVIAALAPTGYFGPLSARVRALFVQHTRTGNPLVDSVAEHRKTSPQAFEFFLDYTYYLWIAGTIWQMVTMLDGSRQHAKQFMILYSFTAYYFADRMSRLMVLAGPVSSAMAAGVLGVVYEWCWSQLAGWSKLSSESDAAQASEASATTSSQKVAVSTGSSEASKTAKRRNGGAASKEATEQQQEELPLSGVVITPYMKAAATKANALPFAVRGGLAMLIVAATIGTPYVKDFYMRCASSAISFANPRLMFEAQLRNGERVMVKDYPEAYAWLQDNTPEDARVLAWWDYGYQITGIGNRTSLADGNTWNHEHIATIGKMLTSPVAEAHSLVRHMADYVLIWAGDAGDLGKSPHMARIGNSVYRDICPGDPLCRRFGFYGNGRSQPTPMMKASLLYNLHENRVVPGVSVDPSMFQEVYTSKYGLVRIYKVMNVSRESKRWIASRANRVCNPSGSWICPGQYPPAKEIQEMLAHRVDFEQLENFNRKRNDTYYKAYMSEAKRTSGK